MKHQLRCTGLPLPLFLLAVTGFVSSALGADNAALVAIVQQCDGCHALEPAVSSNAPVLNGLPGNYLEEQLKNFRAGRRGTKTADQAVSTMITEANNLAEDQLGELARHYSRRKQTYSSATVPGDPDRGGPLFEENCAGCHTSAMGRMFTRSPPITQLAGPYILSQLQAFAAGDRQVGEANEHKLKMIEVAQRFSEAELQDITAYLKAEYQ
jgi:cytochrome c553